MIDIITDDFVICIGTNWKGALLHALSPVRQSRRDAQVVREAGGQLGGARGHQPFLYLLP